MSRRESSFTIDQRYSALLPSYATVDPLQLTEDGMLNGITVHNGVMGIRSPEVTAVALCAAGLSGQQLWMMNHKSEWLRGVQAQYYGQNLVDPDVAFDKVYDAWYSGDLFVSQPIEPPLDETISTPAFRKMCRQLFYTQTPSVSDPEVLAESKIPSFEAALSLGYLSVCLAIEAPHRRGDIISGIMKGPGNSQAYVRVGNVMSQFNIDPRLSTVESDMLLHYLLGESVMADIAAAHGSHRTALVDLIARVRHSLNAEGASGQSTQLLCALAKAGGVQFNKQTSLADVGLKGRAWQIVSLMGDGLSRDEIAAVLMRTPKQILTDVNGIKDRLGIDHSTDSSLYLLGLSSKSQYTSDFVVPSVMQRCPDTAKSRPRKRAVVTTSVHASPPIVRLNESTVVWGTTRVRHNFPNDLHQTARSILLAYALGYERPEIAKYTDQTETAVEYRMRVLREDYNLPLHAAPTLAELGIFGWISIDRDERFAECLTKQDISLLLALERGASKKDICITQDITYTALRTHLFNRYKDCGVISAAGFVAAGYASGLLRSRVEIIPIGKQKPIESREVPLIPQPWFEGNVLCLDSARIRFELPEIGLSSQKVENFLAKLIFSAKAVGTIKDRKTNSIVVGVADTKVQLELPRYSREFIPELFNRGWAVVDTPLDLPYRPAIRYQEYKVIREMNNGTTFEDMAESVGCTPFTCSDNAKKAARAIGVRGASALIFAAHALGLARPHFKTNYQLQNK